MPPRAQSTSTQPKGKRGRKPGSKNKGPSKKKNAGKEANVQPKGKRGRKPGSKNKAPSKKKIADTTFKSNSRPKEKFVKKSEIVSFHEDYFGRSIRVISLEKIICMQKLLEEKFRILCNIYRRLTGKARIIPIVPFRLKKQRKFAPFLPKPIPFQTENPCRDDFWNYMDELDIVSFDMAEPTVSETFIAAIFRKFRERRMKHAYNVIIEERVKDVYDPEQIAAAAEAAANAKKDEEKIPEEVEIVKPVKKPPKRRPGLFGKRRKRKNVQKKK